jgi:hypothetical protein
MFDLDHHDGLERQDHSLISLGRSGRMNFMYSRLKGGVTRGIAQLKCWDTQTGHLQMS